MTMVGRWFSSFWGWLSDKDRISRDIEAVQNATVTACGFLPTAGTVAAIVSGGNPQVVGATAIATAICSAVTSRRAVVITEPDIGTVPQQLVSVPANAPMVNGVIIEGEYVK